MFDRDRYAVVREVRPPRPVVVDLERLWPPTRVRWGRETPLWMRAGGIDLGRISGLLIAWTCTYVGDWLGVVDELHLDSRNRQLAAKLRRLELGAQLIPAAALRPAPRPPDEYSSA